MTAALAQYTRRGHTQVAGWLLPAAIDVLLKIGEAQQAARIAGPVCEIGVHHGRLYILLCLMTAPGERAVAYDLFGDQDQNVDGSGRGDREVFTRNVARHGCPAASVNIVQVNSLELDHERVIRDCAGMPRLFSIDGGHTADITAHDLATAHGAICKGGVIILDDFFNECWPGVAEGVTRYMARHGSGLIPFAIAGNKVLLTNDASAAAAYRHALSALDGSYYTKTSQLFGADVLIVWREPQALAERIRAAVGHVRSRLRLRSRLKRIFIRREA